MKYHLFVLVFVGLGAEQAWAKTMYVDNSCAENGDGTTGTCGPNGPWKSLAEAAECPGMVPGDVLEIRGKGEPYYESWQPGPGCTGRLGAVVNIQNANGENVVLDGTVDIATSTWKPVGGGVFLCSTGTCGTAEGFPFTAWYDLGAGEQRLDLIQTMRTCDATLPAGKMVYTTGGAVCAHLPDDKSPQGAAFFRIPSLPVGMDFAIGGVDFVTLRRNPSGGTFTIRRFRDHGIVNSTANLTFVVNQIDIGWMAGRCINQTGGNVLDAAFRITNNHIHHCGQEGVRWSNDSSTASVVAGNEVDNIQNPPVFERCGTTCLPGFASEPMAFRIAGSSRGVLRNNDIHDVASAGPWRAHGIRMESPNPGVRIDSNYITAIASGRTPEAFGAAISIAGLGYLDQNAVRNNRIHAVDVCVHLDFDAEKTAGERLDVFNNTCNEPTWKGLYQPVALAKANVFVTNNVFLAIDTRPDLMMDLPADPGRGRPIYNAFHCPACTTLVRWKGMTFASDVAGLGPGNITGDPNLDTEGDRPTLKIKGPEGAAFDRGAALGPQFFDFEGTPRPMFNEWDIGADEFGTPVAEPPFEPGVERERPEVPRDAGASDRPAPDAAVDLPSKARRSSGCQTGGNSPPGGLVLLMLAFGAFVARRRWRALLLALLVGGCGGGSDGGAVVISEIMYHPVNEDTDVDEHEFVELHNRSGKAVSLADWSLGGDITFKFPAGAKVGPGAYLVVAKNRTKLAQVTKYGLEVASLQGDYAGQLDNGRKGRVSLTDPEGHVVETVDYSTEFPWPIGADALGLGGSWLPESFGPPDKHTYLGRSLERISVDRPASVDNWDASELDAPTPGRANSVAGNARAMVTEQTALPVGRTGKSITPADPVRIAARLIGHAANLRVEWFVDDVARDDEAHEFVSLPGEIPPQPANSIVRYRILGNRGGATEEEISPRVSDPNPWHAYFVEPDAPGRTPAYHVFVAPANWGKMYTNVQPGWVTGCGLGENPTCQFCEPNPNFDAMVPAVFVAEGRVFDVRVRYQGGLFARLGGRVLRSWNFPGPTAGPMPPLALGWKVSFPKYARFEGKRSIKLNKRDQACTGIPDTVMSRIFETAGIPEMRMRYRRLYINGGYYLYAMEMEHMDEDLLQRYYPKQPIGDLYNCNAIRWDQGPWGWGDFRQLQPFCGFSPKQRYAYNYERQTLQWKDNDDLIALIDGLHTARAKGDDAIRVYLDANFDREMVLRYIALMNWSAAWDDDYHNYFLYKPPGKKWMIMSSDMNVLMTYDPTWSFYLGRENEPGNWRGRWHYLKDAYLRVFQKEYDDVLRRLAPMVLDPSVIEPWIDEAAASFDAEDAAQSLSSRAPAANAINCDEPTAQAWQVRNFVRERWKTLKRRLGF